MRQLCFGCLALLLCWWGLGSPVQAAEAGLDAREIFQNAYEHRYTWDQDFPGYRAEVSLMLDQQQYHGFVVVRPDFSFEIFNIEDDEVREEVEAQLGFEITHRRHVPFDVLHGDSTFEQVEAEEADTVLIRELKGEEESRYRIKDGILIAEVDRTLIPQHLEATVQTRTWLTSSEGAIPQVYQTVFRDPQTGAVLEVDNIRDTHQRIGNYYFLTKRQIRYGPEMGTRSKPLPDAWFQFNSFLPL